MAPNTYITEIPPVFSYCSNSLLLREKVQLDYHRVSWFLVLALSVFEIWANPWTLDGFNLLVYKLGTIILESVALIELLHNKHSSQAYPNNPHCWRTSGGLLKVESYRFEGMVFWDRSEGSGDGGQDKVSLKEWNDRAWCETPEAQADPVAF